MRIWPPILQCKASIKRKSPLYCTKLDDLCNTRFFIRGPRHRHHLDGIDPCRIGNLGHTRRDPFWRALLPRPIGRKENIGGHQ
jgi:hypothetical protein